MKKNFILVLAFLLSLPVFANIATVSNTSGATQGAITSPEAGVSGLKPDVNDTYYTHYRTITGYKSNGKWGFSAKTEI